MKSIFLLIKALLKWLALDWSAHTPRCLVKDVWFTGASWCCSGCSSPTISRHSDQHFNQFFFRKTSDFVPVKVSVASLESIFFFIILFGNFQNSFGELQNWFVNTVAPQKQNKNKNHFLQKSLPRPPPPTPSDTWSPQMRPCLRPPRRCAPGGHDALPRRMHACTEVDTCARLAQLSRSSVSTVSEHSPSISLSATATMSTCSPTVTPAGLRLQVWCSWRKSFLFPRLLWLWGLLWTHCEKSPPVVKFKHFKIQQKGPVWPEAQCFDCTL